ILHGTFHKTLLLPMELRVSPAPGLVPGAGTGETLREELADVEALAVALRGGEHPAAHGLGAQDERLDLGQLARRQRAQRLEGGRAGLGALQEDLRLLECE